MENIKDSYKTLSPEPYLSYSEGLLRWGDRKTPLNALFPNYQRPTFVYDLVQIQNRFSTLSAALQSLNPNFRAYYAMKANPNPLVLKTLQASGAGADVVSGGEIDAALQAGFGAKDIVFSGVGKTISELEKAISLGIHQINVESIPELTRIGQIAERLGKRAAVAFRLNPNVDIKTHPYIATGLKENKFGIELEQLPALEKVLNQYSKQIELVGVSLHLGSMMCEFDGFRQALQLLRPVFEKLQKVHPSVRRFDVGGGIGIVYDKQDPEREMSFLKEWTSVIRMELGGLNAEFQTEPGRFLVAHAGVLVAQVQYIKKTQHKTFVIIDSGMNHLLRPTLYGAHHSIYPLLQHKDRPTMEVDVVGPICESSDFFAKGRLLPELQEGDLIAIADTGAYGASMASTYNLHPLADEICLS